MTEVVVSIGWVEVAVEIAFLSFCFGCMRLGRWHVTRIVFAREAQVDILPFRAIYDAVAILVRTYEFVHHLLPRKIHSLPDVTAMVSDLMEDIWSSYGARN